MSDHLKGLLITVLGVLILSPDTLLIRLAGIDQWALLVYRGMLMAIGMAILTRLFDQTPLKKQFTDIGKTGLLATFYFTISTLAFVNAVTYTSIANTLIIIATSPLFAALIGRVYLGERLRINTLLAIVFVVAGMGLVMGQSHQNGHWLGNICAFISAASIAAAFVLTRKNKQINMVPAIALSGLTSALVALPFAQWSVLSTSSTLAIGAMAVVITIAFALITIGPRYISATEVSLIMPLETVGGIALAWFFLNEVPSQQSLLGAGIILITLAVHGLTSIRRGR